MSYTQSICLYAGHSQRGFEISGRKQASDGALTNEFQHLDDPVLSQHIRDAYTTVMGKDRSGIVCGQRVEVRETQAGLRYVQFKLGFMSVRVQHPKPGKRKATVNLSVAGMKGGK